MFNNEIYIFGAHSRARTFKEYLRVVSPATRILGFLVDNDEKNDEYVDGIEVINISTQQSKVVDLNRETTVFLSTRGVYNEHEIKVLSDLGFKSIVPVDADLDEKLRNIYVQEQFQKQGRDFRKINDDSACIYVAKSHHDKQTKSIELYPYEKYIQVGAALSENRLDVDFHDDLGESISERNKQFCELTGLYWIWKHAREDVVGLVHYRRHFKLPVDWFRRLMDRKIDVILPVPLFVAPSLEENYKFRHVGEVWDCMMDLLKVKDTEEYAAAKAFFETNGFYSPCNMIIAKKQVLDRYCEWVFPILFGVVEKMGQFEDPYQNRYPGFLSERLLSFYFYYHRDEYDVVYADKNFIDG
ncbi:DUF4422 domain-containing protein [Oribacterium sp. WCC10]|uniref:DUF4422 domain-containing protein n=1 Tax=Oribacterium sp. WCC10 TaxID=1855343 RepID=UPI0008E38D5A|nr:DUF4422 domain-containing protein [Oribacterium sp. WCC10]SFG25342.1 protein of unknown function [Oribacterium sp. WCC10]